MAKKNNLMWWGLGIVGAFFILKPAKKPIPVVVFTHPLEGLDVSENTRIWKVENGKKRPYIRYDKNFATDVKIITPQQASELPDGEPIPLV